MKQVAIVGGGLAGVEIAVQLSKRGVSVDLYEARLRYEPKTIGLPHKTGLLAELVCSNSFRGTKIFSASGLLKHELRAVESVIMKVADKYSIPAGSSLTVSREDFSQELTNIVRAENNINTIPEEVKDPEALLNHYRYVVLAVGPSLTEGIKTWFKNNFENNLYFYDAIAPIVNIDSLDMSVCFFADRNSDGKNYLNAPFTKEEYYKFVEELKNGDLVELHAGDEDNFFMGCMPVEELAKSGPDTLRFSPMRGDGLVNPKTGKTPYAAVQLRPEGFSGNAYGMVGFQTRLKYGEQERIFSKIPGFKNVEFLKHGSMHRNTYIDAPRELNVNMSLRKNDRIFLAGQISGVEGYIESTAHGVIVANNLLKLINNEGIIKGQFPDYTAIGALARYLRTERKNFQPSKINFSLFPPLDDYYKSKIRRGIKKKLAYREAMSKRALDFYIKEVGYEFKTKENFFN